MPFVYVLGSVVLISLLSFVGVLSLAVGKHRLHGLLLLLVAFASGSLLAAAFLHMIPETVHEIGEVSLSLVLAGILLFFFIEKFIHWHHCGKEECDIRPVAYLNLLGDGFHNFIDGVIIAAAFLASAPMGFLTTVAIALHEIPQEFGDFSILLHSGMSTRKALAYNFASASAAVLGAVLGYTFLSGLEHMIPYAIAAAAGGFIYIATADLFPELHKDKRAATVVMQSLALLAGVIVLAVAFQATPHSHEAEVTHLAAALSCI